MSSATYLLTDTNETISWTYDRFLSNASIEKKDLSLLGFITGIVSLISLIGSLMFRIVIYIYGKMASKESPAGSPASPSSMTTATNTTTSEF